MKRSSVNLLQIAQAAGVSIATVSRVIHGGHRVLPSTSKHVLAIAKRMKYPVNLRVRPAKAQPHIALVVRSKEMPSLFAYESHALMMVAREVFRANMSYEIIPVIESGLLTSSFCQGAIVVNSQCQEDTLEAIAARMPLVCLNRPPGRFHSVYSNDAQGIFMGLERLTRAGHSRIAFAGYGIDTPAASLVAQARLEAYRKGVDVFALESHPDLIQNLAASDAAVFSRIRRMLARKPTAVMVIGESFGVQVHHFLRQAGARIPDDISIISFEHPRVSCYLDPPHTTLMQNLEEMARQTAAKLVGLIQGQTAGPMWIPFDYKLIERSSIKTIG